MKILRKIVVILSAGVLLTGSVLTGCRKDPGTEEISQTAITEEKESETTSIVTSERPSDITDRSKETKTTSEQEEQTPFEIHGALRVEGNHIVDKNGASFQLLGVSTHGLGWFPQYVNKDAVNSLRDDLGANTLRLAMYTAEGGGYCTGGDKVKLKNLVQNGVNYATDAGMYVIIDWHILHDQDPNVYKDEAKAFFGEMSKRYADQENVIYEICNEPNGGTTWNSVKKYAEEIIPVIRANAPDALIVVGTPTWSQDVDEAVKDPIADGGNLVYAVHFYADTHKDNIRSKVKAAEDAGYPVLISEFSICDASGNGNNNFSEADTWMKLLDEYGIGCVAWNLSNKNESSSLISSGCQKTSGWSYEELSASGKWLVETYDARSDHGAGLIRNGGPTINGGEGAYALEDTASYATVGDGKIKVAVTAENTWQENSDSCTQLKITVTNTDAAPVDGWKFTLDFGQEVSISNIWGGKADRSGSTLTVTPESYNSSIAANSTLSDIGMIVKTGSAVEAGSIAIK